MQNEIQEAKEWFAVEIDLSSHYMEDGVYPEMYAAAKSRKRRYELALAALEQQERDEHIISHYKDCLDITDRSLKRAVADRDAWKARAEALERAIKSDEVNAYNAVYCPTCATCVHRGSEMDFIYCAGACNTKERRNWQFDEQRFSKEANDGQD